MEGWRGTWPWMEGSVTLASSRLGSLRWRGRTCRRGEDGHKQGSRRGGNEEKMGGRGGGSGRQGRRGGLKVRDSRGLEAT